jgi:predicted esterase YcpF (UPF0227 family)
MNNPLELSYRTDDDRADVRDFFRHLPNCKEEVYTEYKHYAKGSGPGTEIVTYVGSALLSSAAVASVIKAWLASRRRKIRITVVGGSLEYEGPNLKKDAEEIAAMIDKLVQKSGDTSLTVNVEKR